MPMPATCQSFLMTGKGYMQHKMEAKMDTPRDNYTQSGAKTADHEPLPPRLGGQNKALASTARHGP